jgi:outer membrane protein TolC
MTEGLGALFMVGFTVPLWREKLSSGVAEAKSMVAMADADVQAMKTMIEGDVTAARAQVIAARARLESARDKVVPLSKKAFDLALASYAGGQTPLVSVLDAARMLREARMEEIDAEITLAAAWARLGRVTGASGIGTS